VAYDVGVRVVELGQVVGHGQRHPDDGELYVVTVGSYHLIGNRSVKAGEVLMVQIEVSELQHNSHVREPSSRPVTVV
jgi:hypothetical protein